MKICQNGLRELRDERAAESSSDHFGLFRFRERGFVVGFGEGEIGPAPTQGLTVPGETLSRSIELRGFISLGGPMCFGGVGRSRAGRDTLAATAWPTSGPFVDGSEF